MILWMYAVRVHDDDEADCRFYLSLVHHCGSPRGIRNLCSSGFLFSFSNNRWKFPQFQKRSTGTRIELFIGTPRQTVANDIQSAAVIIRRSYSFFYRHFHTNKKRQSFVGWLAVIDYRRWCKHKRHWHPFPWQPCGKPCAIRECEYHRIVRSIQPQSIYDSAFLRKKKPRSWHLAKWIICIRRISHEVGQINIIDVPIFILSLFLQG